MNIKIKYDTNGIGQAELVVDAKDIQSKKGREDYKNLRSFLAGALGDNPSVNKENREAKVEKRPHNKSIPHYKADQKLAKMIIDKGGLRYLHGVNCINKEKVFFFDKVPMIQDIVEQYNAQSDETAVNTQPEESMKNAIVVEIAESTGSDAK